MLDGEFLSGFGEVEHIEDDGFGTTVLAAMDRADYLDQGFALMEGTFVAILADDGQFALLYDAVVDSRMVVPGGNGSQGKVIRKTVNSGVPFGKSGNSAPSQVREVRMSSVDLISFILQSYCLVVILVIATYASRMRFIIRA